MRPMYDLRLPGQQLFGAIPDAVAVSADGTRLYVANTGSNAVGVFSVTPDKAAKRTSLPIRALGFVPTEWYPTALAVAGEKLYVATAKGAGTGANKDPQPSIDSVARSHRIHTYIATLLQGSLASIDMHEAQNSLAALTREVEANNLMSATQQHIHFPNG